MQISVGCASIDAQHKLLVELIEKLSTSLQNGASIEASTREVMEFRAALIAHFETELAELVASGYPKAEEHALAHNQIVDRLDKAISALRLVTSAAARFAIIAEIEDVIYLHELKDDAEYHGHLNGNVDTGWSEGLRLGIDWVDEQHRQLFILLSIFRLHARREEWDVARYVFRRMLDRVKLHFDNEDAYLKSLGGDTVCHRRHHFEALLSLEGLLSQSDNDVLMKMDEFVYQLLRSHILDEDARDLRSTNTAQREGEGED